MKNECPDATPELRLISGGRRYPDLLDEPEHFIALDAEGTEVGSINRTAASNSEWNWALDPRHRRAGFRAPTAGLGARGGTTGARAVLQRLTRPR